MHTKVGILTKIGILTKVRTMRKTIYVKDPAIWDRIKLEAEKRGISVSELLLEGWGSVGQLDRIEKKVDALMDSVKAKENLSKGPVEMVAFTTEPPKKSDPAGAKQDIIDSLKAKVAKIPGKKSDPYFRPMEKKGSKK